MRHAQTILLVAFALAFGPPCAQAGTHPVPGTAIGKEGPFVQSVAPSAARNSHNSLDDIVLSEDFESVAPGQLPSGWTEVDRDGGYCSWFQRNSTWEVYTLPGFGAHSGTRFAMCHYNDGGLANDDWLILPAQNLQGTVTLSYWAASQDPAYPESFEVRVSTSGTQPEDFTHLIFTGSGIPSAWTLYTHDLSDYAGAPFSVAFHYISVNEFALKVDDVQLEGGLGDVGVLAGTVTDDSLRPVDYEKVTLSLLGRSIRSDSLGQYAIGGIPAGTYDVSFTDEFHYPRIRSGVVVAAGETTRVDETVNLRPLRFWEYVSHNIPQQISDFDTVRLNIPFIHDSIFFNDTLQRLDTMTLGDTLIIADLDATVSLTHSYVGDLDIWLQCPDSDYVQLVAHDPSNAGQNILNCRFDDQADLPFTAGQAPYTGRFRPMTSLDRYNGDTTIAVRGNYRYGFWWHLCVYDALNDDDGTLFGFALHVATQVPVPVTGPRPQPPHEFSFEGNFPNPFNSQTRLRFVLPKSTHVTLTLYNILGEQAAVILDRPLEAGEHDVVFNGEDLASGVYFARLSSPEKSLTRKILMIK